MADYYKDFLESPEYQRSQDLLAEIGSRTDFDRVKITLDSYNIRLANQADVVDRLENNELIEITGTYGVKVATVLYAYARVAHTIPDCHASIPWRVITRSHRRYIRRNDLDRETE